MTGSKSKSGVQKIQTAALAGLAMEGCFYVCLGRSFISGPSSWVVVLIVGRKRNSGSQAAGRQKGNSRQQF